MAMSPSRRPDRRAGQLPVALRAAAGAALSGLSGRHLAGALRGRRAGRRGSGARPCSPRPLFVLGFSTVFVALGASASVVGALIRAYSGPLATIAGIVIIVMGLHFLGVTPIALLHRQKRLEVAKPVGLWGAYVIGLGFRLRLDALHRADPRRHPGGGGVRADGDQGRRPAWRSIRSASAFRS